MKKNNLIVCLSLLITITSSTVNAGIDEIEPVPICQDINRVGLVTPNGHTRHWTTGYGESIGINSICDGVAVTLYDVLDQNAYSYAEVPFELIKQSGRDTFDFSVDLSQVVLNTVNFTSITIAEYVVDETPLATIKLRRNLVSEISADRDNNNYWVLSIYWDGSSQGENYYFAQNDKITLDYHFDDQENPNVSVIALPYRQYDFRPPVNSSSSSQNLVAEYSQGLSDSDKASILRLGFVRAESTIQQGSKIKYDLNLVGGASYSID